MKQTARMALLAGALALGGAALPSQADAALFWDFVYAGSGVSASGVFETTDTAVGGFYTVAGISGMRNGNPITSLIAPGGFLGNDNLLSTSSPFFTNNGISFVSNGASYNIFDSGPACPGVAEVTSFSCRDNVFIAFSVTRQTQPAPEPVSAALLGAGLLGLAAARRARRAPTSTPA